MLSNKLGIEQLDLANKRVLIRYAGVLYWELLDTNGLFSVDFNVPLEKDGKITNTQRIDASLPTIEYALKKGE